MIIELVSISVPQGKNQEFGRAALSLAGPIQVQPGCLECRVLQECRADEILQIEARWRSEEDLIRHLQSDLYKRLLLLVELGSGPPKWEFLTVVESRGFDLVATARS